MSKTADNTPKIEPCKVSQNSEFDKTEKEESGKNEQFAPVNRFNLKPEHSYKKDTKASKLGKSTGRWTQKEHVLFIEGLKMYGKNWKKVEGYIGTRTGTQIRSHAQKFFNRIRKECSTEDPSKYVIDHMADETIKRLVMEHCGDDISENNEEKDLFEDTPEVLFSITKERGNKKMSEDNSPTARSAKSYKSAFKRFKRGEGEGESEKSEKSEDSKFLEEAKSPQQTPVVLAKPIPKAPSNVNYLLNQALLLAQQPNLMMQNQALNQQVMLMNLLMNLNNPGFQ